MAVETAYEWAWNYTLATAKMLNSFDAAEKSGSRTEKTTAMDSFAETMKGMLPEEATASPQFQYFSAVNTLNNALYSATGSTEKQAAMDAFYSSLDGITVAG